MKIILEIEDKKAKHLLKLLEDLPYVKTEIVSEDKELLKKEIREAVENLKLAKKGKLKLKGARELYNEL